MFSKISKILTTWAMVAVIAISSFGAILVPQTASAQIPVTVTSDIPKAAESILTVIWEGLKAASVSAVVRAVGYAIRKVAYDSAVYLATGGNGQTPLAQTKGFGDYLASVADGAAGTALDQLGKAGGINLCKIPDVKLDLAFKVGLRTQFTGPTFAGPQGTPNCTFSDFTKTWLDGDAWKSKYGGTAQLSKQFSLSLSTDDSPLGLYGQTTEKIGNVIKQQKEALLLDRQEGQGFKAKESKVSGDIQTPAALIAEQFKANTPDKEQKATNDQLNALLANGDIKVIPAALSLFLNTLVGTAVKNFQEKGVLPFGAGCIGDKCPASGGSAGGPFAESQQGLAGEFYGIAGGGVAVAQSFFSYLQAVKIDSVESYDLISQLSNCPENPGLYNCRMDDQMVVAFKQAQLGKPVTIQEAIAQGWLHGDWYLLPPAENDGRNKDKDCFNKAYCYSNVQVLRQLRILPLGFEIAAKNSSPDRPWRLSEVVDGFLKCQNDPSIASANFPFCHLVDPSWVLKVPPAKCNALVYGPNILTNGVPDRLQECVDVQTCVAYDANGNCNDFAYCTREKNTWKFDAQTCAPQYATCRAFTDANGRQAAYLYRTLDTASCTQENVGCRAYSLTQNASGNWVAPGTFNAANDTNTGIYFNNKVSTSCSAGSAGCSAFKVAGTGESLFIKKAPDYLKCYDADPTTPAVDQPMTVADLARLDGSVSCKDYSGVCIPEEVNCNFYTASAGGSERVPGKFTPAEVVGNQVDWNDQCDAKCVGYDAYREMPSNYSSGQSVAYIIPSSGTTCAAADEGCSAFTNLSTTQGGLEKTEYFSYLRTCAHPSKEAGKNFITYEGSVQGGFQLKTYLLVENKDPNNGPIGAPKYSFKTTAELAEQLASCTEATYRNGTAPLDCRQFNDDSGKVYYRLLSNTIPVSESCTPYRLSTNDFYTVSDGSTNTAGSCSDAKGFWDTSSGTGVCKLCFQNGEYREGSCFYDGLPGGIDNTAGVSRSCSASADTCRAYKGNAGNNVEIIFNDTFENVTSTTALSNWSGGALSNESVRVNEHSFSAVAAAGITRAATLIPGQTYDLTFWAKGNVGSISVRVGGMTQPVGTTPVNDTWNTYRVGPFTYNNTTSTTQISFVGVQTNTQLFVDNVRVVRVRDLQYLVKKSLSVDPICDSDVTDNLPGEALGCSAYADQNNRNYYLTGFSYLCRENAIGCTAVLDTKNTPAQTKATAHNVWVPGRGGSTAQVTIGGEAFSCVIPTGDTGCYITVRGHEASQIKTAISTLSGGVSNGFVSSTIYVPSDTTSTYPMYLVANQAATCNQADLGCTFAGAQQLTPGGAQFTTALIKNDPALYDQALCGAEAVGCNAYSDGADTRYFKDPAITGQKVCAYAKGVPVKVPTGAGFTTVQSDGWFWKGAGVCSNDTRKNCSQDSQCGAGNTCTDIGSQPCYRNYLSNGEYSLWSSENTQYNNFVGECPANQNACTQFVDRTDNNKSYYFLKDNRVSEGDCAGQVSQKEGCAVFDQVDNPNKFFNTKALYAASEANNGRKVPAPVTADPANDGNIIIKVNRDRECGEWLQCQGSKTVFDRDTGKYKDICENVQRCAESDGNGGCKRWVQSNYSNQVLSEDIYRSRAIGWSGMDYTGYSILGLYPVEELTDINFSTSTDVKDYRLVKPIPCGGQNCPDGLSITQQNKSVSCKTDGQVCGKQTNQGLCVNKTCVRTTEGKNDFGEIQKAEGQICRGYPEKDAPFPFTSFIKNNNAVYGLANKCSETAIPGPDGAPANTACDCDYTKVNYGDALVRYWNREKPNMTEGLLKASTASVGLVCVGGDYADDAEVTGCTEDSQCSSGAGLCRVAGVPVGLCVGGANGRTADSQEKVCTQNSDCAPDGTCQRQTNSSKLLGYRGYCLETDSRSVLYGNPDNQQCLTWFPGRTNGTADLYNQFVEAGFDAGKLGYAEGGPTYCAQKEVWEAVYGYQSSLSYYLDCDGKFFNGGSFNGAKTQAEIIKKFQNANGDMVSLAEAIALVRGGTYRGSDNSECTLDGGAWACMVAGSTNYVKNMADWSVERNLQDACAPGLTPKVTLINTGRVPACGPDTAGEDEIRISFDCVKPESNIFWRPAGNYPAEFPGAYEVERVEDRCKVLYETGDNPSAVVGFTQNLWKQVEENGFPSLAGDCLPYSATSLNVALNGFGPMAVVVNSRMLKPEYKCEIGQSLDISSDKKVKTYFDSDNTGIGFQQEDSFFIGQLKRVFAKAVRFELSRPVFPTGSQVCRRPPNPDDQVDYNSAMEGRACSVPSDCFISQSGGSELSGSNYCSATAMQNDPQRRAVCEQACRVVTSGSYTPESYQEEGDGWDVRGASGFAPTVLAVGNCRFVGGKERCQEGGKGITVFANNQFYTGGIVPVAAGTQVSLRFFAFADNNQMPIRKLAVNWGDGDNTRDDYISGDPSYYRNQRGAKDGTCEAVVPGSNTKRCILKNVFPNELSASVTTTVACVITNVTTTNLYASGVTNLGGALTFTTANGTSITSTSNNDCQTLDICSPEIAGQSQYFGLLQDKSCNAGYYQFKNHVYECNQASENYCRNINDTSQPNGLCNIGTGGGSFANGFCVFQPKVYIQDNWGWCTGTCNPAKGGCFAGGQNQCFDQTGSEIEIKNNAWQVFGSGTGRVVVPADAPPQ